MLKNKIFDDCVIVNGNCYRIETGVVPGVGCVMVSYHPIFKTVVDSWILMDDNWNKTNMRNGIVAHECGHLALAHHLIPISIKNSVQKLRNKSHKLAIQLEIDADTWACYYTPFKEELLRFVEYLHIHDPNCLEYKVRLENLIENKAKIERKKQGEACAQ